MNKINLKARADESKTVKEIFDEAPTGQVFIITTTLQREFVVIKAFLDRGDFLLDLSDGMAWSDANKDQLENIDRITPIKVEIN